MNYEELVTALRDAFCKQECNHCGLMDKCFDEELTRCLLIDAANAIEEMNRRIDRAIELYNRNVKKSAMYEALAGISPEPPKEEGE